MRILMFGWEFPPFNSGGLGTACQGLTRALSRIGHDITFVLPRQLPVEAEFMNVVFADVPRVNVKAVNSLLDGYITEDRYRVLRDALSPELAKLYGGNLYEETQRYGEKAYALAHLIEHDVIHAHDWLSIPAGMAAKAASGKPLIVHVHATEFDRTGNGSVNQMVYDIERAGMHAADAVVTVSEFTREKVIRHYGVPEAKVHVVHNGIDPRPLPRFRSSPLRATYKIVLFLGRLTLQKGPDYFLETAKRVLEREPDALFIVTGSGDMERQVIMQAAELGIGDRVIFTGFRRGDDVDRLYQMADVYVMPSVSEPFGITALESVQNGTPVVVSKQSGVREVLPEAAQTDFWDTHLLADRIVTILRDQKLSGRLLERQLASLFSCTWHKAAEKCSTLYARLGKEAFASV